MKCMIGIDDSDSAAGLCTTFLAYKLATNAMELGFRILEYPRLVRLNPNIPFKTRGNAAVSLVIEASDSDAAFKSVCSITARYSDVENGANTGVVMLEDLGKLPAFKRLYRVALSGLVNKTRAARLLSTNGVRSFTLGNGMGLVGASASLGFDETYDHTYEIISYRRSDNWGTRRRLSPESVSRMDSATFPHTYNNYDYEKKRPLIAPHGPDPVFAGIRGDSPESVLEAFSLLRYDEDIDGHMIYLSNQCTEAHLGSRLGWPLKAYHAGWFQGEVKSVTTEVGGHVFLELQRGQKRARAAVYKPTGDLYRVARRLAEGDRVMVAGGVRRPSTKHPRAINVETLIIQALVPLTVQSNPTCSVCGSGSKSEGAAKGFQCRKCGARMHAKKRMLELPRALAVGHYVSSPRANRHLTKPLIRYGMENPGKSSPLITGWIGNRGPISLRALAQNL
ncbi:MAG: tRNA(Ile)(2)-agmatinylcytidine synthase [Thaumarchaeota archaeon]|nr:tRNA(Ile)(2)-agmatinylcytidine synthase [Nitrososphaerota archaeon]